MKLCICHTYGCPNNGFRLLWDYDTDLARLKQAGTDSGTQVSLANPTCGACSQPIVDVTDDNTTVSPGTGGISPAPAGI